MLSISLLNLLFFVACEGKNVDTGSVLLQPTEPADTGLEEEEPELEDTGLPTDTIEIIGSYENTLGERLSIDENQWNAGVYQFQISQYDNEEKWAIAQNASNNPNHPERWSKFEWVFDGGGSILYCQSVFDASSEEDAVEAASANREDFAQGCNGSNWSAIRLALEITGAYQDSTGIIHQINAWEWLQDTSTLFYVTTINNEEKWLIAENGINNSSNPNLWSVFQWTIDNSDTLYYCHSSDDSEMKEDAITQDFADPTDLTNGCNDSGWISLQIQ